MRVDFLIPAHNEEDALPHVVREIPQSITRRIVVVDNASTDQTAEVGKGLGCDIVYCAQPGYGAACLAGMAHIAQDPPDILIFLDGDYSDYPEQATEMVECLEKDCLDFVLGSRTLGQAQRGSLNFAQRFGNGLATGLMRLFWGTRYTDLGPFRAIRWEALQRLGMCDTNFGWTIEMQIKAHMAGLRTREIPANYRQRIGTSKISGTLNGVIRAGYKILFTIFKYRFLQGKAMRALQRSRH